MHYSYISYMGAAVVAIHESKFQQFSTIRHTNCEVLLPRLSSSSTCAACMKHRKSFNAMLSKHNQQLQSPNTSYCTSIHSHTNYRYLTSDDKTSRLRALHNALELKKQHLKNIIDANKTVTISKDFNDNLLDIMQGYSEQIAKDYPKESFPHWFWQQQMQAASVKNNRSIKWHPMMIKWCLYLQHKSSGGYQLLRDSG